MNNNLFGVADVLVKEAGYDVEKLAAMSMAITDAFTDGEVSEKLAYDGYEISSDIFEDLATITKEAGLSNTDLLEFRDVLNDIVKEARYLPGVTPGLLRHLGATEKTIKGILPSRGERVSGRVLRDQIKSHMPMYDRIENSRLKSRNLKRALIGTGAGAGLTAAALGASIAKNRKAQKALTASARKKLLAYGAGAGALGIGAGYAGSRSNNR